MKLRFTERALRDLNDICSYIRHQNPYAAERVGAAILGSLEVLLLFPNMGRPQTVAGVRKLVTRRYRYLVYYRVDESAHEVVILTVQHPAREREYEDA